MASRGRVLILLAVVIGGWGAATCAAEPEPATLAPEELAEGWIELFDNQTLYGWEPASDADWKVHNGVITASQGTPGLLVTTSEFADYVLRLEFRAPLTTNSGVFLRTPPKPTDPAKDCYELNIATPDLSPFPTGSFVNRKRCTEFEPGLDWQSYEVTAQGGHFAVKLNGEVVLDYVDPNPIGRGRIGLQFRSGAVEFRRIRLKPLGLASLFNGKDLAGWKVLPGYQSVYSVTSEGWLNVKNGKGQLETEQSFGDFTLQLEVFSNGERLNSGIFFRSIPGEYQNGYECQIQNGIKDDDPAQPLDCGTGGFYRRQNARRVMSKDFEWFPLTLIVSGKHMAAWVKGRQVSDWTDPREPDPNPRKGLRTAPGTLIIQGHDPTTDLSFRKLQAAELPPLSP